MKIPSDLRQEAGRDFLRFTKKSSQAEQSLRRRGAPAEIRTPAFAALRAEKRERFKARRLAADAATADDGKCPEFLIKQFNNASSLFTITY